jgi:hypothetical protein
MDAYEKGLKCEGGQTDVHPILIDGVDNLGDESWVSNCVQEIP